VSFCAVIGCPGQGYPYHVVLSTPEGGVREVTLCTEHRKRLPRGYEILSIEKRDPGPSKMDNPYRAASSWEDVPFRLPD